MIHNAAEMNAQQKQVIKEAAAPCIYLSRARHQEAQGSIDRGKPQPIHDVGRLAGRPANALGHEIPSGI